ncbi:hypothetical protein GGU10DRAFT_28274 [Lentinula aff. detonsa]|uniref:Uncharacterized protein n=1 Tax=Lentinula aff. detonsa TaxID=2804958 RepID=A0AA38KVM7_9AGAR|nr:hypothetical protein GGU10DRAFT_28274 [Lentinula aff. detonsa]
MESTRLDTPTQNTLLIKRVSNMDHSHIRAVFFSISKYCTFVNSRIYLLTTLSPLAGLRQNPFSAQKYSAPAMQLLLRPVLFICLLFLIKTFATPVCTRAGTGSGQVFSASDSNSGFCNVRKLPASNSLSIHSRALDGRKEVIETRLTLYTPSWPDESDISEEFAVKIYNATQIILPLLVPVHPDARRPNIPENLAFNVKELLYFGTSKDEEFSLSVDLRHNGQRIVTEIDFEQRTFESQSLRAGDLFGYADCYHNYSREPCFRFRNGFYQDSRMEIMKRFPELEITKVRAVKARKGKDLVFTFENPDQDQKSGESMKSLLNKIGSKMGGRGGAGPSGS